MKLLAGQLIILVFCTALEMQNKMKKEELYVKKSSEHFMNSLHFFVFFTTANFNELDTVEKHLVKCTKVTKKPYVTSFVCKEKVSYA